jgi:hypothetical protein
MHELVALRAEAAQSYGMVAVLLFQSLYVISAGTLQEASSGTQWSLKTR